MTPKLLLQQFTSQLMNTKRVAGLLLVIFFICTVQRHSEMVPGELMLPVWEGGAVQFSGGIQISYDNKEQGKSNGSIRSAT